MPLLDASRGAHQLPDRTGGAAPEHRADQRGEDERDAVDQQHGVAQVAIRSEHVLQGLQQDEVDRVSARVETPREAQVVRVPQARDVREVARRRERARGAAGCGSPAARQRRGDPHPIGPVGDDRDLRADQIADLLRQPLISHEPHRDPGYGLRGSHRREEELIGMRAKHPEVGLVAHAGDILEQTRERSGGLGGGGRRRGEHPAVGIEQQHHIGADALGVVVGG